MSRIQRKQKKARTNHWKFIIVKFQKANTYYKHTYEELINLIITSSQINSILKSKDLIWHICCVLWSTIMMRTLKIYDKSGNIPEIKLAEERHSYRKRFLGPTQTRKWIPKFYDKQHFLAREDREWKNKRCNSSNSKYYHSCESRVSNIR